VTPAQRAAPRPRDFVVERGDHTLSARIGGSLEGPLVIYLHGSPSSRLDIDYLHDWYVRRGIRLAAFDRPGFGGSTPHRFDLRSIASDAAAVADSLDAPEFRVVGQSSGVAYAAATAAFVADRVAALATGGGGSPFEPDIDGWAGLSEAEQRGIGLIGTDDVLAERLLSDADAGSFEALAGDDAAILAWWRGIAGPADNRVMDEGLDVYLPVSMREAVRQGRPGGWARDNVVRMGPWHVDLTQVRCPATIWLGEEDRGNIGPARWLADHIAHADLRILPGYGHFVIFELWDAVLDAMGLQPA
jgi:pimeloyl-ACP methyl ester carboxylesterase